MPVTIKGGRITTDDRGRIQPRDLTPEEEQRARNVQDFAEQLNQNPNVGLRAGRNITGTTLADLLAAGAGSKYGGDFVNPVPGASARTEGYGTQIQNTLDYNKLRDSQLEALRTAPKINPISTEFADIYGDDMRMYDPFPDPTGGLAARARRTDDTKAFLGDDAFQSFFGPRNFLEKGIGALGEFGAKLQGLPLYNEDGTPNLENMKEFYNRTQTSKQRYDEKQEQRQKDRDAADAALRQAQFDPCPEGYVYDSVRQMCVPLGDQAPVTPTDPEFGVDPKYPELVRPAESYTAATNLPTSIPIIDVFTGT